MMPAMLATLLTTDPGPTWTLSTADTRATVGVVGEQPGILSLRNVGDDHEWCVSFTSVPLVQTVVVDGKTEATGWRFAAGRLTGAGSILTLNFKSRLGGISLRSVWRARKGRGPIEHWVEIVNKTASVVTVPLQESLALTDMEPGGAASVWWVRRGAGNAMT